jgi:hypothetical protein
MENLTVENFLPVIIYALIVNGALPLLAKMLPVRQQAQIEAQRKDNERKDREVIALEKIGEALGGIEISQNTTNERLAQIETGQVAMSTNMQSQTNLLTVLTDRVSRPRSTRSRKGE